MFLSGRRGSIGLELLFMMSRREDLPLGAERGKGLTINSVTLV